MSGTPGPNERLYELLSEARLGSLSAEEYAELESLRVEFGADAEDDADLALGELLLAMDEASGETEGMPADLARRLGAHGRAIVGGPDGTDGADGSGAAVVGRVGPRGRGGAWLGLAAAASIVAAVSIGFGIVMAQGRGTSEREYEQRLAEMRTQIEVNQGVLAAARDRASLLEGQLEEAESNRLEMAQRLADATQALDRAELTIAKLEAPEDPAVLAQNRRKLLEVPGTVRLAWTPFDLPDAPAEQREVRGDVVWNDELETGYLRFEGLKPNDPSVEQYQVWVIDDRGLEQKVSGGVFNATAAGEVIVPIHPGIDVGRVALFAITVENPGGTWVPDLERRVVVAPRGEG